MAEKKEVSIRVSASDAASKVFERVAATAEASAARVNRAGKGGEAEGGLESTLKGLDEKFGRNAAPTHLLHLLEGKGPIVGLGIAAELLGKMGERVGDLDEKLADGTVKSQDIAGEWVKLIPIVGQVYEGMHGIGMFLGGISEDIEDANEQAKDSIEATQKILDLTREIGRQRAQNALDSQRSTDAYDTQSAQPGVRDLTGAQHAHDEAVGQHANDAENQIKKVDQDFAASEQKYNEKISSLEQKKALAEQDRDRAASELGKGVVFAHFDSVVDETQKHIDRAKVQVALLRHAADAQKNGITDDQKSKDADAQTELDTAKLKHQQDVNQKALDLDRQHTADVVKSQADFNQAWLKADADNEADAVKRVEKNLKAQKAAIDAGLEEQITSIKQKAEDAVKASPDQTGKLAAKINMDAGDDIAAAKNKAEQAKLIAEQTARIDAATAARDQVNRDGQIQQQLAAERIQMLTREGELGNAAAAEEAKRLQLAEQFNEKKRQLQQIISDPASTPGQRQHAQTAINALPQQQQQEQREAAAKEAYDLQLKMLHQQAEQGNQIAGAQAKVLEITKEYRDELAVAKAIVADSNADPKSKAAAQTFIDKSPAMEKRAIDMASQIAGTRLAAPSMSGDASGLSGADLQAARFGGGGKIDVAADAAKTTAENTDAVKDHTKTIADFAELFLNYKGQLQKFLSGLGGDTPNQISPT